MKHEWADGCKARSHGSEQVLIIHTARAGLFIFNLQVIFLVCIHVQFFLFACVTLLGHRTFF